MDYNVKDFGALGDGVTDDTAAIQAAIDAAHAAGGGTVHLPAGEFRVSAAGEPSDGCLMLKDNVYLAGAGMGQTVIRLIDGSDQKITGMVRSAYGEETSNFGMRDLTLDGNRANTTEKVDGWFNGYIPGQQGADRNVTLERVEIREMSGYGFDPHEQTINLTIRDSVAHHNGLDGFVADYLIDSRFENNLAYANDRHGFNVVTSTHDFVMTNNVAHGNGGAGVAVQRGSYDIPHPHNILIDGGAYYDNGLEGVLLKLTSEVTLQNADIHGNGTSGVRVYGAQDVQILNNQIQGNAQNGAYPEIGLQSYDDTAGVSGTFYATTNTWIEGNLISGSANSTYGVQERNDGTDYSRLYGNSIDGVQRETVLLKGAHSMVAEGGEGADELLGTPDADTLLGHGGSDTLDGAGGDDILVGGGGRDDLAGGEGADLFRFEALTDSRRNYDTADNQSDRIADFDPAGDRLDVSALGFTGLGDGYGTTLAIVLNDAGDRTYLKNYETDASGYRFEFSLDGNYQGLLGTEHFVFAERDLPQAILPFDGVDVDQRGFLVSLYIGAFNRAPDYAGLEYWTGGLAERLGNGLTPESAYLEIGRSLYAAGEGNGEGGTHLSNEDFVAFAYRNSLGRDPDQDGFAFWTGKLNGGDIERGDFLTRFLTAATTSAGDGEYLRARIAVAEHAAQEHVSGPQAPGIDLAGVIAPVVDQATASAAIESIVTQYGRLQYGSAAIDHGVFGGSRGDYALGAADDSITITPTAADQDKWVLIDYERLQFDDGAVAFDIQGNAGQAYRLYQAAFGRAPDEVGLGYWMARMDDGTSLQTVAQGFIESQEFAQLYGAEPTNEAFVDALYRNVLEREPDQTGSEFWVGQLESGAMDESQVLVSFSESEENRLAVIGEIQEGIDYQVFAG